MRASLLPLLLLFTLAAPLRSEPLPGAEAPAFIAARAQWLEGEDMAALTALSALAQGGNAAAQLMLGVIDQTMALHPDALAELPRAERIALLRAPGGLSGRNWLVERRGDLPLAAALDAAGNGSGQVDDAGRWAALQALLAAGEARAALAILATGSNHGGWGPGQGWDLVARYAGDPALDGQAVQLLDFLRDYAANPDTAIGSPKQVAMLEAALRTAGAPASDLTATRAAMSSASTLADSRRLEAAVAAAGEAPQAAPLRSFCTAACPESINACTFALLAAAGGMPGFVTLSPLESVIPTSIYRKSPRFADDLRAALGSRPLTPPDLRVAKWEYMAGFDTCAATELSGPE
jgi:hypothetical protein